MSSIEENSDDWREIRGRVDSVSSAIFLIAGGALSLSISVLLGQKSAGTLVSAIATLAVWSWICLLGAVFLFLLLKAFLIFQASMLQFRPNFVNEHVIKLYVTGWVIGLLGFASFIAGMTLMVVAASEILIG